jgi:hypothetical protein
MLRTVYNKPKANIFSNGKKLSFSSKVKEEIEFPSSSLLFSIVLEFLSGAIRQEKEIKVIQIGKKEVKLSLQ